MAEESFAERTEQATPRRRREARRKGQVAKSREIPAAAILLLGSSILYLLSSHFYNCFSKLMVNFLHQIKDLELTPANLLSLQKYIFYELFLIMGPILLTILAMGIISNYAQVGHIFAWELIQPKFSKLNALQGLQRIFSKETIVELIKALAKFLIVGTVVYYTIEGETVKILNLAGQELATIVNYLGRISFIMVIKVSLIILILAIFDYLYQRWRYEKSLRMSKQEVQEEFKQTEGDPLVKSRLKSRQRSLARQRMMNEVPKADVVITNPQHLAVALGYKKEEMVAPKVLAKGAGLIAEKIKEIARAHSIPIIENKPLAQIIYKSVEIGEMIPSSLYQAVAEVLAYVYTMKMNFKRAR
ncbi:MAG: flagellar biosynthesis protein FlhB [Thermodesulfobacteriota bacterium]